MPTRLILLPGLGTDSTLLDPQKAAFPHLEVPELIERAPGESFRAYSTRFLRMLGTDTPFFIGGISFGGMIALEALRDPDVRRQCRGVILIASCRSARAVRGAIRMHRLAGRFVPDWVAEWGLQHFFAPAISWLNHLQPDRIRMIMKMAKKSSIRYIRWGANCTIEWDFAGAHAEYPEIPVFQIHGAKDRLFPLVPEDPDVTVPGAGHLINMSYADEVNRFIESVLVRADTLHAHA